MWFLLLLIPAAAGAAYYKKKSDAAAQAASPPPVDAATYAAAQQGVPAAVAAVQAQLDSQLAAGQANPTSMEFPDNSPEQNAQNAAVATAQQQAASYQTVAQADAALQGALTGTAAIAPKVYSADYATAVYQKAIDAGQTEAQAEALRAQAISDYSAGNYNPVTGIPYRIQDTRTATQKVQQAQINQVASGTNRQVATKIVNRRVF